jgi:exosome complex component RRP46
MTPLITTSPLHRTDGSATCTTQLFSILAAANGPIEVQRRDELPEEAFIEVNIRLGSGVGGPRERWLESIVASVLRSVILVHLHPRTLVQVTLQVLQEPGGRFYKGVGEVALLPSMVNAAFLALVDGGLPLERTLCAALVAVNAEGELVAEPMAKELFECTSVHAMAFDVDGEMMFDQSTGSFGLETWHEVAELAKQRCLEAIAIPSEDGTMANGEVESEPWLRQALEAKVHTANAWRETT